MENLRIAIVGIGNMGSSHAKFIDGGNIPNATLSAICDISPDRLEWAKKNLSDDTKLFESFDELMAADCCDGIIIATPHYFHPPIAIKAFEKGIHVLSEKPAGVFTKDVREMNEKAVASGLVFGLMFQQRTNSAHQKLRDLVQSGEIGELRRVNWIITNWFRTQSYYDSGGWRATWEGEGGGVLINQCPHQLDLWQWICGMPSKMRAFCKFGESHDIEVEDNVTAYAEYANGATAVFITTTGEAPGTNRLEIVGTQGKLVYEGGKIEFSRNRVPMDEFCRTSEKGFGKPECWQIQVPTGNHGGGHGETMKDWALAIQKGTELLGPGVDGIKSLTLSNAMLLSTWTDSTVDLDNFDEDLFYNLLQEKISSSTIKKDADSGKVEDDMNDTF